MLEEYITAIMASKSALFNAISSHDPVRIEEALKNVDINFKYPDGNALVWAITGATYNQTEPIGKGRYETVELLLKFGADPNIVFFVYPPLYNAVNEQNDKMIALLLNYGANVNSYFIKILKDETDICFCRTALIHAIDHRAFLCVEALVKRGALFNKVTLDYAEKIKEDMYKTRKVSPADYIEFERANKIFTILKEEYSQNPSYEEKVREFLKANSMTHKKLNYFVGLEK